MFRRDVKKLDGLLSHFLRETGLETPLLQRRLVDAWSEVAGQLVANYTSNVFIANQTLMVKIDNSALRAELSMMKTQLVGDVRAGDQVVAQSVFLGRLRGGIVDVLHHDLELFVDLFSGPREALGVLAHFQRAHAHAAGVRRLGRRDGYGLLFAHVVRACS